jgi:Flp pilus assembly protein TadD
MDRIVPASRTRVPLPFSLREKVARSAGRGFAEIRSDAPSPNPLQPLRGTLSRGERGKKSWSSHALRLAAILAFATLLCACGAHTGGYADLRSAEALTEEPAPDPAADRDMYLDLITKMQQRGLYFASLAHIDSYAQRYGEPPELRILRAEAERETGKTAAATAVYRDLLDGSQSAAAYHGLGLIAAGEGRYADAARNLEEAVRRAPINGTWLGDLGYARLRAGDIPGAREPLAKAAELDPDNPKAIANLALLLAISGHGDRADAMMREAKLPLATREGVARLAADIYRKREHARSDRPSPTSEVSAKLRRAEAERDSRLGSGISETMLDRFGSRSDPPGDSDHDHR